MGPDALCRQIVSEIEVNRGTPAGVREFLGGKKAHIGTGVRTADGGYGSSSEERTA